MNTKELRLKNKADLLKELQKLFKGQFSLKIQKGMQQLTNSSQISRIRRDIARVQTVLSENNSLK